MVVTILKQKLILGLTAGSPWAGRNFDYCVCSPYHVQCRAGAVLRVCAAELCGVSFFWGGGGGGGVVLTRSVRVSRSGGEVAAPGVTRARRDETRCATGVWRATARVCAQDGGLDTVAANAELGLPVDTREYTAAAHILRDLGVGALRLLTNNPAKVRALSGAGEAGLRVVERVPSVAGHNAVNAEHLATKREKMGHLGVGDEGALRSR